MVGHTVMLSLFDCYKSNLFIRKTPRAFSNYVSVELERRFNYKIAFYQYFTQQNNSQDILPLLFTIATI